MSTPGGWPDTFGGLYVDQAHGGIVDFAFTADVETHEAALRALTPPGAEVRVREVALAEIDLDALVDTVSRDSDFQESRVGITVHNVRTNTAENAVEVFIEPYAPEGASLLVGRYGSAVRILPGTAPQLTATCTNRDSCDGPPIMAGVSNDWGCTVGFGVWMDGYRRFLTAGHCVQQTDDRYGRGGWTWYHNVTKLGVSTDESWFDYSPADAGSMGNISSTIHSDRVARNNTGSWYGMASPQSASNDYAGYLICQSGQTSGLRCGKILTRNATPNYSGVHMKWQRQADYQVQGGDSGAPVISSSATYMAVGLQSGCDNCTSTVASNIAYYSHIQFVLAPNGPDGGIGARLRTEDY